MSLFSHFMKFADDTILEEFDYIRMCPDIAGRTELESYLDKYNLAISSLVSGLEKERLTSDVIPDSAIVKRKHEAKEVAKCGLLSNNTSMRRNSNKDQKQFQQAEKRNEILPTESIKTSKHKLINN